MDPRTGLDDVDMRKSFLYLDSNSDLYAVQPVASRFTEYAIPALTFLHPYKKLNDVLSIC